MPTTDISGKLRSERLAIADEIIRRVDTVTIVRCEEVDDIRRRALAGEFDGIFDSERVG